MRYQRELISVNLSDKNTDLQSFDRLNASKKYRSLSEKLFFAIY